MITINQIAAFYQERIIDPSLRFILRKFPRLQANQLTIASCVVALAMIIVAFLDISWLATLLLLIVGYLDTLDGPLARMTKTTSLKGSFLDLFADRFVEFCAIFSLYSFFPNERGFFCILMLGALLVYLSAHYLLALFSKAGEQAAFGPGKKERLIEFGFFALMMLIPPLFAPLSLIFLGLLIFVTIKQVKQFLKA